MIFLRSFMVEWMLTFQELELCQYWKRARFWEPFHDGHSQPMIELE